MGIIMYDWFLSEQRSIQETHALLREHLTPVYVKNITKLVECSAAIIAENGTQARWNDHPNLKSEIGDENLFLPHVTDPPETITPAMAARYAERIWQWRYDKCQTSISKANIHYRINLLETSQDTIFTVDSACRDYVKHLQGLQSHDNGRPGAEKIFQQIDYWDHADADENANEQEWENRRKLWEELLAGFDYDMNKLIDATVVHMPPTLSAIPL